MKTFLLTWNPQRFDFAQEQHLEEVSWSCGNTKKIKKGDRAFLMRLGADPKGIIRAGLVTETPYLSNKVWDSEKEGLFIKVKWENTLDDLYPRLMLDELPIGMNWTPQSSGIEISPIIAYELEIRWRLRVGNLNSTISELEPEISAFEGEEQFKFIRHRKRENKLRNEKIKEAQEKNNGRLICEVPNCGFDFEKVYGETGKGYAHVHHLKPLANQAEHSETKLRDLVVVCANCHAMIHKGGQCRELKDLIG